MKEGGRRKEREDERVETVRGRSTELVSFMVPENVYWWHGTYTGKTVSTSIVQRC